MVRDLLKEYDVHFMMSQSDIKASVVERFNRTLKQKMWRYFTANDTYRYIDKLDQFVQNYNRSPHRSIGGMRPAEVNSSNFKTAWKHLYGGEWPGWPLPPSLKRRNTMASSNGKRLSLPFRYKVGDQVRVSVIKGPFGKGYLPNWTPDAFTVERRYTWEPPVYKLRRNSTNELLDGVFYEQEMLPYRT